jgi:hypothetical protein
VRSHLDFARGVMDRGKTFVLSASSNGDSIAQWIAYGENLEGYAIGFQVPREALSLLERHPFDPEADPDGHGDINQYVSVWRDVLYDTSAQAAEADAFVDLLARLVDPAAYDARMAGYSFNELLVRAYAPRGYAGIVTRLKRHSWVHEQEVRITATALDASRFHETSPAGRSHVTLTGFVRPASITGTSSFTSALPTPLPMVAVRAGPKCPHSDLRALLDANGYDKTDAHRSEVAYR